MYKHSIFYAGAKTNKRLDSYEPKRLLFVE